MEISQLLIALLMELATVLGVDHCYQCSDPNIETHYGAFFVNPRVLQEGNRNHVNKCDRFAVPVVECDGPCYSLNVTSLHVKSREVLPFGTAYGCSQFVLGDEIDPHTACTKKDILLRTTPPYVVQAEYCLCSGDVCNSITQIVSIPQRTSSGRQKFYINYVKKSCRSILQGVAIYFSLWLMFR
uniref:Protein sleepless n=1 Tax=Haemonchus contortus TaxID=6289 RepID=A0A7I4Y798_HAECO